MPYKAKGRCVYRADTGKKVGCTKGPVKKYLAALHANVPDAKNESKNNTTMKQDALKKVVQYLAKEAEDIQKYTGVDASYDVEFGTLADIITDSGNKKLQNFWSKLNNAQQMEIYNMVHQFLLNKEIKRNPSYFGGEKPQTINYTLSKKTKSDGPAPKGAAVDKLVKKLAEDVENWVNYIDTGEQAYEISFDDFVEFVIDAGSPKIKNLWNSLGSKKQEALYNKIITFLEKKHGYDDGYGQDDEIYENKNNHMKKIKLSEIAKKIMEGKTKITLNGKEVDPKSIEIDGVDHNDYPDFSDAYISAASYVDGTPVDDNDLQKLEDQNYGITNQLAHGQVFEEGYNWRDNPDISRDWEKSDVSQDEFEKSRGYGRYSGRRSGGSQMKGITFFNVPAGKEAEATQAGLTQLKSGKWGYKHRFDPNTVSVASDGEKSAVSAAEKIFGKGKYWEPRA